MYREMMTKSKTELEREAEFKFDLLESVVRLMMRTDNHVDLDCFCVKAHQTLGELRDAINVRNMENNWAKHGVKF